VRRLEKVADQAKRSISQITDRLKAQTSLFSSKARIKTKGDYNHVEIQMQLPKFLQTALSTCKGWKMGDNPKRVQHR